LKTQLTLPLSHGDGSYEVWGGREDEGQRVGSTF